MKNKTIAILIIVGFIYFCLLVCILKNITSPCINSKGTDESSCTSTDPDLKFRDSVLNYIFDLRIDHPYIVLSQSIIESGNYKSRIFLESHNMFGMKVPGQRPTTALSVKYGHAVYSSWKECVLDYALYQSAYCRGLTEEEYFIRLQKMYAKDKDYIIKIKMIKEGIKEK